MNFITRRSRSVERMGNTYDRRTTTPMDGGYDAEFDEALPDELTCCICFLAFREPMQLSCGHQYCRYDNWFKWVKLSRARKKGLMF